MAALLLVSELLQPGWIGEFRRASTAYYEYTGGGRSVLDVALTPVWGRLLAGILVAVVVVFFWRSRQAAAGSGDFCFSLALSLAATLVVIPMFAPYNQLLLVPVVMWIVRGAPRLWKGTLLTRVLLGLAALCVLWPWIACLLLLLASAFLPAVTVQKAWALPLFTSLTIPIAILALVLVGRNFLRLDSGETF
jgi:hypothetical protein